MPVLDVYDITKKKVSEIELSSAVFDVDVNTDVIHEVVRMQLAAKRAGNAATKGRSDISGGGKKPWRQKGTGRARSGTSRSPVWRGGGTVFGPQPREYSFAVPKKVRRLALKSALTLKVRDNKMLVLNDFPMDAIKTRVFQGVLNTLGTANALFVLDKSNVMLEKSSQNIRNIKMMRAEGLNVYDLLKYDYVVMLEPSVKMIEGALLA